MEILMREVRAQVDVLTSCILGADMDRRQLSIMSDLAPTCSSSSSVKGMEDKAMMPRASRSSIRRDDPYGTSQVPAWMILPLST